MVDIWEFDGVGNFVGLMKFVSNVLRKELDVDKVSVVDSFDGMSDSRVKWSIDRSLVRECLEKMDEMGDDDSIKRLKGILNWINNR